MSPKVCYGGRYNTVPNVDKSKDSCSGLSMSPLGSTNPA